MSAESWKLENDLCRCCHSEGSHKNLTEPCLEGEEEVYSAMLQETLDINIVPVSGPLGSVTYTICEVCIMRLQDAWSFKQQVLQCENRFHDLYTRNVIKMEPDSVIINVKEEAADSENEGFKEGRLADDSDEDFSMPYEDGTQKSDESEIEIKQETKKAKPKPKAKPKAKAPAKAAGKKKPVARSVPAADAASSEAQSEEKEKKDASITPLELSDFTAIKEGTNKRYRCNKCGKDCATPWRVTQHIKYAHVPEAQTCVCNTCNKKFMNRLKLYEHTRSVHMLFDCPECPLQFTRKRLRRHRLEEHGAGVTVYTCGICEYKSDSTNVLAEHQRRVHMKEKNVACPQCDMKFFDKNCLKMHMVRHNPVKQFGCQFCSKMFSRRPDLKRHERIHTGEKRKVCNVCGERFVQKASLSYHMLKRHPDAV